MGNSNLNEEIDVIIRLLPQGDEVDVSLPLGATGKEIIDSLLGAEELGIPQFDPEGNRYTYKLTAKESGRQISEFKNIADEGIKAGYTLLLMPQLVAGQNKHL